MYCIILPRARGKMIQLTTHYECLISSTNVTLCLFFFLSSCSLYLTVYYTFESNKIYSVIKAGKNILKKWITLPRSPLLYVSDHKQRSFWSSKLPNHASLPLLHNVSFHKQTVCASSSGMLISACVFSTGKWETRQWYSASQK